MNYHKHLTLTWCQGHGPDNKLFIGVLVHVHSNGGKQKRYDDHNVELLDVPVQTDDSELGDSSQDLAGGAVRCDGFMANTHDIVAIRGNSCFGV